MECRLLSNDAAIGGAAGRAASRSGCGSLFGFSDFGSVPRSRHHSSGQRGLRTADGLLREPRVPRSVGEEDGTSHGESIYSSGRRDTLGLSLST